MEDQCVPDARNMLAKIVRHLRTSETKCVQFIDPYGDTVFNALQVPMLIAELEDLERTTSDEDEGAHLHAVVGLLRRHLNDGPHRYVRFVGD